MEGDPTHAPRTVKPKTIVGRYALFDEVASGGMASVHLGRLLGPVGFSRTVAIKRLHPQHAKDPAFSSMFLQEARLASRIQHPHVVSTIDIVSRDDEVFLVMEYVHGETLAQLFREAGAQSEPMEVGHAATVVAGVLHGLHAAHEAKSEQREPLGIVHRDVSPQNILVGTDGVGRVLDFGVAKAARLTEPEGGQVRGKLNYMSPEQLNGRDVDRRTDVFAAGVVLWEALAGRRLFDGSDAGEIVAKMLTQDIPRPSTAAPGTPAALEDVVMKALERDPERRFQTAREFAVALEQAAPHAPARAVGEWVEILVGPRLEERRHLIAAIERASAGLQPEEPGALGERASVPFEEDAEPSVSGPRPVRARSAPVPDDGDEASVPRPPAPSAPPSGEVKRSTPTPGLTVFAVVACLAGGTIAYAVFGGSRSSSDPLHVQSATKSAPEARRVSDPAPTTSSQMAPTFSIADLPEAEWRDAAAPTGTEAPSLPAPPRRAPSAGARPVVKKCDPPWTVDSKGIRRPKPECL